METFLWFRSESSEYWMGLADFGSWMVVMGVCAEVPGIFIRIVKGWPRIEELIKLVLNKLPSSQTDDSLVKHLESSGNERLSAIREKVLKHYEKIESLFEVWDLSWLMVVILGLVIELGANQRARRIDSRDNANLHAQAGRAEERAGEAIERAALANERAKANELQLTVARSNLSALELRVQWRTISPEQETNLVASLRPSARHRKVLINVEGADNPEAERYAARLAEVLKKCDFDVNLKGGLNIGVIQGGGLLMNVRDRNKPPPHAIPIINAFRDQNLRFRAEENRNTEEGVVYFWVFPKEDPLEEK